MVYFLQVSPPKNLYTPLLSNIRATCPAHLILLDFITRNIFNEECISLSSLFCSFLHSPFISSLLGPNILPTPYSQTPSSLNVRDQVLYPYKNSRQDYNSAYLNLLCFWIADWKTKDSATNDSKHYLIAICS